MASRSESLTSETAHAPFGAKLLSGVRIASAWGCVLWAFGCFYGGLTGDLGYIVAWSSCLLALWFVVFIHELGHAAAAYLCGWDVIVFAAGSAGFHLANKQFAWIPRSKRREVAGFILAAPRSPLVWTRNREAIIDIGGPAASLIFAGVSLPLGLMWRYSAPEDAIKWPLIAFGVGLLSLATTLVTILPNSPNRRPTDMQNFMRALRTNERQWRQTRALRWLHGLAKHKVRLRDLPWWMVEEAHTETVNADAPLRRAVEALMVGIVLDSPPVDVSEARKLLDDFRGRHGSSAWLEYCDAYFSAVWENDVHRARTILSKDAVEDDLQPLAFAAEAAVAAREGNGSAAETLLKRMHQAVRRESAFEDQTFADIDRQIRGLLAGRPSSLGRGN